MNRLRSQKGNLPSSISKLGLGYFIRRERRIVVGEFFVRVDHNIYFNLCRDCGKLTLNSVDIPFNPKIRVLSFTFFWEFSVRVRVRVRCPWPILLYCRFDILKFVVTFNL